MDTENSTPQANTTTEDASELAMLRADRADDHATMQVMRETIARRTDTLHLLEAQRDELLAALKAFVADFEFEPDGRVTYRNPHGDWEHEYLEAARAAIARATGAK